MLGLYVLFRVWHFDDKQTSISGRLANWVNNELVIGDQGETYVSPSYPFCTDQDSPAAAPLSDPENCIIVLATAPREQCSFWWIGGDCLGLFSTSEILGQEAMRQRITRAIYNACTSAPPEYFWTDRYCTDGALSSDIFILSIDREENTLQLAFVVPKMTRKAALHPNE